MVGVYRRRWTYEQRLSLRRRKREGANSVVDIFRDTFTDADGTALASHTPDLGGAWTKNAHANYISGGFTVQANRIWDTTARAAFYTPAAAGADYRVKATIVRLSDDNSTSIGVCARMVTNADTFYYFRYNNSGDVYQLFSWVAGVGTQIGSNVAGSVVNGVGVDIMLDVVGSTITGYVDGVAVVSGTDTAISAAGRPGIRGSGAMTTTTGLHYDAFSVQNR